MKLPPRHHETLSAIDKAVEQSQPNNWRQHLGCSVIGKECRRALWYDFHWATDKIFQGRILRLFKRGQNEEAQFCALLRAVGCTVVDVDPKTGEQFTYSDIGGHFGGSMDAAVQGLKESEKWHVAEFKTHSDSSFKALKKDGVEKSKPEHFAQMQMYMHFSGMIRAFYLAVNKNDDELYSERVKYDKKFAEKMLERARTIITAPVPLERISERPDWYSCKWCDHHTICHGEKIPNANCRTCAHSTAELDGKARWSCSRHGKDLDQIEQQVGCQDHVYIPDLVPYEFIEGSEELNCVTYRNKDGKTVKTGTPSDTVISSDELRNLDPSFFEDPNIEKMRQLLGARIGVLTDGIRKEGIASDEAKGVDDLNRSFYEERILP